MGTSVMYQVLVHSYFISFQQPFAALGFRRESRAQRGNVCSLEAHSLKPRFKTRSDGWLLAHIPSEITKRAERGEERQVKILGFSATGDRARAPAFVRSIT